MTGSGENFSNFGDLRRRFGDGDDEEEVEETAETVDAGETDEVDEARAAVELGVRERIDRRPCGFGPMTHGPSCYADEESEEMQLMASFRVRTIFPEDVSAETASLAADPSSSDYEGVAWRADLRNERIFTIDGEDAKDFDDAICMSRGEDGGYRLSVHIADVSHYVVPGTALDDEALARATSVYVADQVVPMLPEALSNELCSLVPGRPRLAFSVFMDFDKHGKRTAYTVTKSVIKSMRRCTYKQVQALLDGVDDESTRAIADLKPDLEIFAEWTKLMQKIRDRRGSLRMQSRETKFEFDADGRVQRIRLAENYFSQTLIEETALAANQAVGDFFKLAGLPTIYRIHPEKDPEEQQQVLEMLEQYGVRAPRKERLTGRDIGQMIRYVRGLPNAEAMIARVMGLLERAVYEVADREDTAEHFGLAREHYLHFTSPIRRYPDLVVHRMLHDVLMNADDAVRRLTDGEWVRELAVAASHSTTQSEVAAMVETAIDDLKLCQYMEPKIGQVAMALIERVSRSGLDIRLLDDHVTGYLPARTIGSETKQEGPVLKIKVGKRTRVFREGDRISVRVLDVDFVRLKVLFDLPGV